MSIKPTLLFAHANGFPASSYCKLFGYLGEQFIIDPIYMLGHDPSYPVNNNLTNLVDELILNIEQNHQQPVIGVGHSLGGILLYMAARLKPTLFQTIILMDSLLFSPFEAKAVGIIKRLGLMDKVSPSGRSLGRRTCWPNIEAAIEYFKTKSLFKGFDPDCLRDYVQFGTVSHEDGIKLVYDPDVEVDIFRSMPHKFPVDSSSNNHHWKLAIPAGAFYGKRSNVIKSNHVRHLKHRIGMQVKAVEGGHMFPLQHPYTTAVEIVKMITFLLEKECHYARA